MMLYMRQACNRLLIPLFLRGAERSERTAACGMVARPSALLGTGSARRGVLVASAAATAFMLTAAISDAPAAATAVIIALAFALAPLLAPFSTAHAAALAPATAALPPATVSSAVIPSAAANSRRGQYSPNHKKILLIIIRNKIICRM